MNTLAIISVTARILLFKLMEAALVRNVAFAAFEEKPLRFETHPRNRSLTWNALEALEGSCVVQLVEYLRKPNWREHIPPSVDSKLEKLVGHRHVVSHPGNREQDWRDRKMIQFETDGRRYESRVPLAWDLQQALNAELATQKQEVLPDFAVSSEMVGLLRLIWMQCLKQAYLSSIPGDDRLRKLLEEARLSTLQQCARREGNSGGAPSSLSSS